MNGPTDEQIFNYNLPTEPACAECDCDEIEVVDRGYYVTYICQACGFEPRPEEEE